MMTRQTILAVVLLASTVSQARWYSSETGRFLSDDEVPAAQKLLTPTALDPWSYAAGNPLRYADPTGRVPMDPTPTMTANASCGGAGHPNCSEAQYQARFDADMRGQLAATVGQLAVMCAVVPGCREALVLAGKYFGIGYTAAWLAGTQGHREDGSFIESIPDPVNATLDGVAQAAAECRSQPGATMSCGMTALVVVPPVYAGTRGVGRILGARLSPSVEVDGALNGMAAAERRAIQASVDAANKTLADQGMSRVGEAYAELYGSGEYAGMGGGETEAGWWGGQGRRQRLPQDGTWSGEPGNSNFTPNRIGFDPDDPTVVDLRPGESVPFVNGDADFSRWAWDEFDVAGLDGSAADFTRMERAVADRYSLLGARGDPTAAAGRDYLRRLSLAPHHAGGTRVQLIPGALHGSVGGRVGVPHRGGASLLRSHNGN